MQCLTSVIGLVVLLTVCKSAVAVEVYESSLSKNAVCVRLTETDVAAVKGESVHSVKLGAEVAFRMIRLAGIPGSITSKVSALAAWAVLCAKYSADIGGVVEELPEGGSVTLKYHGVNLEAIRRLWDVGELGDYILPGGELTTAGATLINEILNGLIAADLGG